MLRVGVALALLLPALTVTGFVTGCAFDPNGFGPLASGGDDGGGLSVDGQIAFMRDGGPGDAAPLPTDSGPPQPVDARVADAAPPGCNGDGPTCDGDYAAVCSGGRLTRSRLCPEASFCLFGECAIPFGSSGCSSDASCSSGGGGAGICTPFVQHTLNPFDPPTVTLRCATPRAAAGTGAAGAACTSPTDCRTGICVRSRCWGVCGNGSQCTSPTQCMMAPLQVDGVTDDVTGCFAP